MEEAEKQGYRLPTKKEWEKIIKEKNCIKKYGLKKNCCYNTDGTVSSNNHGRYWASTT
jgi:formylglycine-generating enzyme required for sulfatase activity